MYDVTDVCIRAQLHTRNMYICTRLYREILVFATSIICQRYKHLIINYGIIFFSLLSRSHRLPSSVVASRRCIVHSCCVISDTRGLTIIHIPPYHSCHQPAVPAATVCGRDRSAARVSSVARRLSGRSEIDRQRWLTPRRRSDALGGCVHPPLDRPRPANQ